MEWVCSADVERLLGQANPRENSKPKDGMMRKSWGAGVEGQPPGSSAESD